MKIQLKSISVPILCIESVFGLCLLDSDSLIIPIRNCMVIWYRRTHSIFIAIRECIPMNAIDPKWQWIGTWIRPQSHQNLKRHEVRWSLPVYFYTFNLCCFRTFIQSELYRTLYNRSSIWVLSDFAYISCLEQNATVFSKTLTFVFRI